MKHIHLQAWEEAIDARANGNIEQYGATVKTLAARGNTSLDFVLSYFSDDSSREIALDVVAQMDEKQQKALLSRAVNQGLSHRYAGVCWRFIEALPREWVEEHIEASVMPLLEDHNDEEAYRQILSNLYTVNRALYKKIANEGTQSLNKDIREYALDSLAEDE